MRARVDKKIDNRCEIVPLMNFCDCWPSVDYVFFLRNAGQPSDYAPEENRQVATCPLKLRGRVGCQIN